MHPSDFINDLWNGTILSEVFVAMSFHDSYLSRYEDVYKPAIESIKINTDRLQAVRVDERKSGDSIVTEIVKGISQSEIVIADISSMGMAPDGYNVLRNGNVMYELGLAHAVKSPAAVIIIKDDNDKMLFDVSSIPHFTIDFSDTEAAKERVKEIIIDRIQETTKIFDFKLQQYSKSITPHEFAVLKKLAKCPPGKIADLSFDVSQKRIISSPDHEGIVGLIASGIIESHIRNDSEYPWYSLTYRGRQLCRMIGVPLAEI